MDLSFSNRLGLAAGMDKNADFIVYNSAHDSSIGMESNMNEVSVYSSNGKRVDIAIDRKDRIAEKIIHTIISD